MILIRNVIETNKQLKTKGTRENVVNLHELFVGLLYNLPKVNNKNLKCPFKIIDYFY